MYLVMKFSFEFLLKYFLIYSYFAAIPEIPETARLQFRPKPTSSGLEVEAKFYFQH